MANKGTIIDNVVRDTNIKKKDATKAVESMMNTIRKSLSEGDDVRLIDFGTFKVRSRAARKGRNPQTGEEIPIPATVVPTFEPSGNLKDIVVEGHK